MARTKRPPGTPAYGPKHSPKTTSPASSKLLFPGLASHLPPASKVKKLSPKNTKSQAKKADPPTEKRVTRGSTKVTAMASLGDDVIMGDLNAVNSVPAATQDQDSNRNSVFAASPSTAHSPANVSSNGSEAPTKKKRGRPKKVKPSAEASSTTKAEENIINGQQATQSAATRLTESNINAQQTAQAAANGNLIPHPSAAAGPTTRQPRSLSGSDSPLTEVESPLQEEVDEAPRRSWRGEGKRAVRADAAPQPRASLSVAQGATAQNAIPVSTDGPEPEDDESIDEGDIDYNDHHESEHYLDPADDVEPEVIPIDDDTDDEHAPVNKAEDRRRKAEMERSRDEFAILQRPWRAPGAATLEMRRTLEIMYCHFEQRPINNSWDWTERYQYEKDKEYMRYLEDFPLPTWILPPEQRNPGWFNLGERVRLRTIGVPIYGQQIAQQMQQMHQNGPAPYMHGPQGQMMHPQGHPIMNGPPTFRQNSFPGFRPAPGPPHQGQHAPPPNHVLPSQPHGVPQSPHLHGPSGPNQYPHPQHMGPMAPPAQPQPQFFGRPMAQGAPPNGMPYHLNANGQMMGPPHGPPMHPQQQQMQGYPGYPGMPPQNGVHGHGQIIAVPGGPGPSSLRGGPRKKKEPVENVARSSPDPECEPPYAIRPRPAERQRPVKRTGKKQVRKQAECEEFPWHRQNLNFVEAKNRADWNTDQYDPSILDAMAQVRERNIPVIVKIDNQLAEQQKNARNKKKADAANRGVGGTPAGDPGDGDYGEGSSKAGTPARRKDNIGGDPYYSGNFSFVNNESLRLARSISPSFKHPDDILEAFDEDLLDPNNPILKDILICWNPGKKGVTQDLDQAVFRMYDTIITRHQLKSVPILTKRAAECIVDFCPDLLWREALLRIVSEAGYGNKDVRNRICYNGCYADKATVTKRIAAALGQKQITNPRKKKEQEDKMDEAREIEAKGGKARRRGPEPNLGAQRYLDGEKEWNDKNKEDFDKYIRFFGKRRSNYVRAPKGSLKRDADAMMEVMEGDATAGASRESSVAKRARTEETEAGSPMTDSSFAELNRSPELALSESEDDDEDEQEENAANDEEDDEDAVSVQSDGVLDEIED